MPKIRKQKRKKTFKHDINRKRLRNKSKRVPKIHCNAIREAWDDKQSIKQNLQDMGLSSDPNKSLRIPTARDFLMKIKEGMVALPKSSNDNASKGTASGEWDVSRVHVAEQLEREAKERKRKVLRLSQMQVDKLGYLIEKYDMNYRAMTKDRLNYDQHTWRQLRAQIKKFMGIPEQWEEFWKSRGKDVPARTVIAEQDEDSS